MKDDIVYNIPEVDLTNLTFENYDISDYCYFFESTGFCKIFKHCGDCALQDIETYESWQKQQKEKGGVQDE
jgi:hypothetical protein